MTSDVCVRINVTTRRFEGKLLRRLPCSHGRIILLFNDVKCVAIIKLHTASLQSDFFEKHIRIISHTKLRAGFRHTSQLLLFAASTAMTYVPAKESEARMLPVPVLME